MVRSFLKTTAVVALTFVVAACGEDASQSAKGGGGPKATVVNTLTLAPQTISLIEELPGRTVAYRKIDVRPQVDGIIEERKFTEGAFVEVGQELYLIDQGVYKASLAAAKAELASERATMIQTSKNRERFEKLVKRQAMSQQNYDEAVAAEASARAAVAAAQAKVDQAEINLEDTIVTAQIAGQIGSSNYNEGSLVTASQANELTTVTQLDPIYVDVTQAGGRLLKIKQSIQSGRVQRVDAGKIEVSLVIDDTGETYPLKGTLQFSDVSVNETTGTVRLRAVFPNPNRDLLPGMFVRGLLAQGQLENAYLIAQKAVMRRPDGSAYVYVVEEGKVASRNIVIERAQGSNWIVSSGVNEGDQLIVDGLQRIGPGAAVSATSLDPKPEPTAEAK